MIPVKADVPASPGNTRKDVTCTVCGSIMATRFCSTCGQEFVGKRITNVTVTGDILSGIFSLERSLFSNLRLALVDPFTLVNNFWNGYRRYHAGPGRFLAVASLLLVLNFLVNKGYFMGTHFSSTSLALNLVFLISFIPICSIISWLTLFWFRKNMNEHSVMNIYNLSLWTIIFVPISMVLHPLDLPYTKQLLGGLYLLLVFIWNARCFPFRHWSLQVGMGLVAFSIFGLLVYLMVTRG